MDGEHWTVRTLKNGRARAYGFQRDDASKAATVVVFDHYKSFPWWRPDVLSGRVIKSQTRILQSVSYDPLSDSMFERRAAAKTPVISVGGPAD
jgi:hypothetical protein